MSIYILEDDEAIAADGGRTIYVVGAIIVFAMGMLWYCSVSAMNEEHRERQRIAYETRDDATIKTYDDHNIEEDEEKQKPTNDIPLPLEMQDDDHDIEDDDERSAKSQPPSPAATNHNRRSSSELPPTVILVERTSSEDENDTEESSSSSDENV